MFFNIIICMKTKVSLEEALRFLKSKQLDSCEIHIMENPPEVQIFIRYELPKNTVSWTPETTNLA